MTPSAPDPRGLVPGARVYVALAGGGAKGIVHVGALKALETAKFEFEALSGTSIGALVAALKAAGYSADDIIDAEARTTILREVTRIDPAVRRTTDLFGPFGWWRIWLFRLAIRHLPLVVFGLLLSLIMPAVGFVYVARTHQMAFQFAVVSMGVMGVSWLVLRSLMAGLATLDRLTAIINRLLQEKLFETQPDRVVRMDDFGRNGLPALKIISANLSRGRLEVFSQHRNARTPAAEAIAASICLPIIFPLPRVGDELFADGGIVSNLPAWPFDEERELDPAAITIAIDIQDQQPVVQPGRRQWLAAFVRTGFFGGAELNVRAAGTLHQITLDPQVGVLDFDLGADLAFQTVRDADTRVRSELRRAFEHPQLFRRACAAFQEFLESLFESYPALVPEGLGRIRVAIAAPDRDYVLSLRLQNGVGFDRDADQSLLLPIVGSIAGKAWTSGAPQFAPRPFPADLDLPDPKHWRLKAQIQEGLQWVMAIPIFATQGELPRFVVCIDGDRPLAASPLMRELESVIVEEVRTLFRQTVVEVMDAGVEPELVEQ